MEAEIGQLPDLSYNELKARWQKAFGVSAPKHISRKFLINAVTYHLRDRAGQGFSAKTKKRLREIAAAIRDGRDDAITLGPRIRPGTRLVRAWKGESQIVEVLADGFEWQGTRYASLSAVAKAITGTSWNGYAFFGVKRRAAHNKNAAGPRCKRTADTDPPSLGSVGPVEAGQHG